MPMTDRELQIQKQVLNNIYKELSKRNIEEEKYCDLVKKQSL